ncbi:MAG: hypothetical protein OXN27_17690 [Candidatus Poribacteria bacterium]|nr:hypothetical protein [Candidatus Poribacteria bacterium]
MYRYIGISILVVLVVCGTGCDYVEDEDGYADEDMTIKAAYLTSVSSVRPAEVTIGAIGWHNDTCVGSEAKVYANREGNKIYLSAQKKVPTGTGACGAAVTGVRGEVTLKNLDIGEYIILDEDEKRVFNISDENGYSSFGFGGELGRFRIEPGAAYMEIKPAEFYIRDVYFLGDDESTELDVSLSPIVPDSGELEDTSYQVKAAIDIGEFHYELNCEPIYKIDIEHTANVINLDIWHLIPSIGSGCALVIADSELYPDLREIQIDLGTFSWGSYNLYFKGKRYFFSVPHPIDGDAY